MTNNKDHAATVREPLKPRSDSLYSRLARHHPELLDRVFRESEEKGGRELHELLREAGVECSERAVYDMLNRHHASWRMRRVLDAAEQLEEDFPGDLKGSVYKALKTRLLELAFTPGLAPRVVVEAHAALLAERRLEVEEKRLSLAEDMFEIKTSELILKAIRKHPGLFADIARDSRTSDAEKIQRIRERMFGKDVVGGGDDEPAAAPAASTGEVPGTGAAWD